MQGNAEVIVQLNHRLSEELAAIMQYMVHAEMCESWGYAKLSKHLEATARTEMRHAEALIQRIIFLEGTPNVARLGEIRIGANVSDIVLNDYDGELLGVRGYNQTMALAAEVGDNGTREMLAEILKQEEAHIDWLEAQRSLIEQMGLSNYLLAQTGE
ncbi:bacterioferritin [Meiothermus sp. CFH 77666]|uniref:bacterioferritin n=1 Tax=Meiothermus sp. CFH 77666 TaxID=2817942 RepID=UPI001AA0A7D5|nr:bacterioferritin [Meiothermus sp. CFH 77666]MBO1438018.1 bacterioferritin [Meiothermus sp. CFH 77666]